MSVNSTFYLDAANLASAVSVYLDASLLNIAPDGFYSDGTISRQQSSGILLTAETCVSCATPCGGTIAGAGAQGIYLLNIDVGGTSVDVGAIIIRFNPQNIPDGIRVTYDSVVYNKLSSPIDGYHQSSTSSNFTLVGNLASTSSCSNSWYPAGGSLLLNEYLYDGTTFPATGNSQTIAIAASDISLSSPTSPNFCVMVIPKPLATPNLLNIEVLGPCGSTAWNIEVYCPVALPSFTTSTLFRTPSIPCVAAEDFNPKYFAKVHLAVDNFLGLYDYVFLDANGQFPLADGYYLTGATGSPAKVIEVVNGIVVAITNCI